MATEITLSVLIPTYCRADLLQVCLQSIIDSRVKMLEVVIGDDGGDEATKKVCENFAKALPIIYLPPRPYPLKGSLSSNLNRLLKAAKGEWILLLHDDDFLLGDHSSYPIQFYNEFDFYFTDHFNTDKNGLIDEEKSKWASNKYGRIHLKEGLQQDVFDLAINERVCLDGFYVKTKFVKGILPDESLGPVADFFWMFYLLNSGIKVGYLSKKTFAYRSTDAGLTANGIDFDKLINGYKKLKISFPAYADKLDWKISYFTWYAINKSIRNNERRKAWEYMCAIKFSYKHSFKAQFLMLLQLLLLILPSFIAKFFHK